MNVVRHNQEQSRPPDASFRIFNCRGEKFRRQVFVRQILKIFRCRPNPNVKDSTLGIDPSREFMVQTLRKRLH